MKIKFLWMGIGSLLIILLISATTFFTSYERNVGKMLKMYVKYKDCSVSTELSNDICNYLTDAEKRQLYFGSLPSKECAIEINSPSRATLYVYPLDEESIIIRYEPRNGIKRNYKNSGCGDFNRILKAFYELTNNQVFN